MDELAGRLQDGASVKKDYAAAVKLLVRLVQEYNKPRSGSSGSSYAVEIGDLYLKGGYGLQLDIARAAYWFCRAEYQGHGVETWRLNTLRADFDAINMFCNEYDDEYGAPK